MTSVPQDTFPFATIHPPKLPSRWRHCFPSHRSFENRDRFTVLCSAQCLSVPSAFVSALAKWLAGKTICSRDIFRVEGFPLQRPDWRVIYCNVCIVCNVVSFNFAFL